MDYLYHHGIKGQRWGIRRFQNSDGSLTELGKKRYGRAILKTGKTQNLDKFGKDENHNVLYITGYSGSGKSTLAKALARKNDHIISLDFYQRPNLNLEQYYNDHSNKVFDSYLDSHFPNLRTKIRRSENTFDQWEVKNNRVVQKDDYAKSLSEFRSAIESFSREQYKKGNRLIVEGVQLKNNWFSQDNGYYSDKPVVIVGTSQRKSFERSWRRDRSDEIKMSKLKAKQFVNWYMKNYQGAFEVDRAEMNEFSRDLALKKGKRFMNNFFT